ncbi:MAG: HAMP domain-containing histidine kinase [Proteobacteria bacterium]|nr:MAG: HAMP domain-containing histidine kinase [Pseudomonadota bacterium]
MVEVGLRGLYFPIRISIILALVGFALMCRYKDAQWYSISWAVLLYIYSISGEYFRPLYIIALFQFQAVHAVYFRHSRKAFFTTHVAGTAIFLATMLQFWPQNLIRLHSQAIEDQMSIAICSLAGVTFLYFYFESIKSRAETATNKLALVGSYATSLIHDIKNLSTAPLLYAEMLNDESRQLSKADVTRVAQLLHTDLVKLERLVKDLYDTSKPEDSHEICSLREACEFATRVLGPRMNGVKLSISGESEVETNKRVLNVILLNLFYNALNAFEKFEIGAARVIEIVIQPSDLTFVSHSVRDGAAMEERTAEVLGLGLYLIAELGKQSNVRVERKVDRTMWITRLRFSL